jgi:HNH endonuclease
MAICTRCNNNVSFWAGGVNKQTGQCRKCQQEVRIQTLATIRNGSLPHVRSSIHLDTDEMCHLEMPATYQKQNSKSVSIIQGRFIATSKKLHFLASTHTYTISWNNVLRVNPTQHGGLYLELTRQGGTGYYTGLDGEYAAAVFDTLTRMAKRQIVSSSGGNAVREIPQDVKSAVWQRDGGRCRQCGAQQYLEYDHIIPFSRGGASSVNNVQLLCRQCNQKKGARI